MWRLNFKYVFLCTLFLAVFNWMLSKYVLVELNWYSLAIFQNLEHETRLSLSEKMQQTFLQDKQVIIKSPCPSINCLNNILSRSEKQLEHISIQFTIYKSRHNPNSDFAHCLVKAFTINFLVPINFPMQIYLQAFTLDLISNYKEKERKF